MLDLFFSVNMSFCAGCDQCPTECEHFGRFNFLSRCKQMREVKRKCRCTKMILQNLRVSCSKLPRLSVSSCREIPEAMHLMVGW